MQKIRETKFEDILLKVKPEIDFLSRSYANYIKSYDRDDISQELTIKLWDIINRELLPKDMIYLDFRFIKFIRICFKRKIFDLRKVRYVSTMRDKMIYKDLLDTSIQLNDDWENFV